jgi:hypothetical protein
MIGRCSLSLTFRLLSALLPVAAALNAQAPPKLGPPIQLHPQNPHYFLFQGRATVLITSGEHYGAVINTGFDYHRYLATLADEGMNYTRIFAGSYVEVPAKSFGILRNDLAPAPGLFLAPWARSSTPGYAGGGNKFDLDHWNPAYFERLRDFLADAGARGIIVEISFFSSQYGEAQWNLSPFNRSNNIDQTAVIDWKDLNTLENGNLLSYQERYVRKIVRETNAYPNVIFEIANEPWSDRPVLSDLVNPYLFPPGRNQFPNSVDLPDERTMAWQERVAGWISDEEASLQNKHLLAQNYCNFRYPIRRLIPGVSIVNFHYAYPEAASLNYGLGKAVSYDETGFLGRDDASYIRQAWNFLLSGGSAFDGLDYSFTPGHEDGTDTEPNGPGGGSPSLRHHLRILRDFLQALPLPEMVPDTRTVKHGHGVVARVLSSPSGIYALFLDGSGPAELSLRLPPGEYSPVWMDVQTGKATTAPNFRGSGGELPLQTPEFSNGIALLLTRGRD